MTEDEQSKETRYVAIGLIALAIFAMLFIGFAIAIGESVDARKPAASFLLNPAGTLSLAG